MEQNNTTMSSVLKEIKEGVRITKNGNKASCSLTKLKDEQGLSMYRFHLDSETSFVPEPIELEWKLPALNVKGVWKPTSDFAKRIEADWELANHESRISIDSPVISVFGNNDENIICFSCSNAINKLEMGAKYREEDDHIYCKIILFTECKYAISNFSFDIRVDCRSIQFSEALQDTSRWWETFENLKPAYVPDIAKKPLYSTWYQFHQDLEEDTLLQECQLAKNSGFEAIIIDDGWQTQDNNRGYDFTGDWESERFKDFGALVSKIQDIGLKVGIWYSVPFCGKKSKAYKRFKGKFLTEDHRWAPVFDPRYPDVRDYLVGIYVKAAQEWGLDGFKLDFIDDFKAYPDTPFESSTARDFSSINDAVDALLTQVSESLKRINPEIFIEFRQKYTGPAMRKYGNMLRAFDCPGDATMNRVRIADLRMLSGNTAIHSDMVTWHGDEEVAIAALQLINTLFGVPQLSIFLKDASAAHARMVDFYMKYWTEYADILLDENYVPSKPLANYPLQKVTAKDTLIVGIYEPYTIALDEMPKYLHIHNGQLYDEVIVRNTNGQRAYSCKIYDCQGTLVTEQNIVFDNSVTAVGIPPCGILIAEKL